MLFVVVLLEGTGAALAHPPKSSSAATVGAGLEEFMLLPQPAPISPAVKVSGTFIMDAEDAGAAAGAGSGVPQALPPQGSMLAGIALAMEEVVLDTLGFGAWGAGLLRLKAELSSCWGEVTVGRGGGEVLTVGAGGDESPNKSLDRDEAGGGLGLVGGGELKPVNPESNAPELNPLEDTEVVRDCGLAGGIVGDVRLSKRPPPAPPLLVDAAGEVTLGAAGVDLTLAKLVKLANGEGFSAGLGGGGDVVEGKLSPLKASVRPPIPDDADWGGGEAKSPNDGVRSCWAGAGCGLEYSDRMDCFKSGLDIPGEAAPGVDAVLAGRLPLDGGGALPKKSSPSNESPGRACLGAGCACLGAGRAVGSVVLGRTGGAISSSPNRSMEAWGRLTAGGWLAVATRCEADRSIFAFSWTTARGTSSSPTSRVAGSGMPPSITHRLDSYLVRMKFSIFASDGTWPWASFASQYLLARALPHRKTLWSCSSVHASRSTDFTRLIWVPMPR